MRRNIRLMLVENVENLGIVGDVVEVRSGYARNYLLPHGLATDPTPANMQRVADRRAEVEQELEAQRRAQESLIQKLEGFELTFQRSANETGVLFGSVTQHDVAEALRAEGLEVKERDVRIGSPIKLLDTYAIPIQLSDELNTEIKLHVVSDQPAEESATEGEEPAGEQGADEGEEDSGSGED